MQTSAARVTIAALDAASAESHSRKSLTFFLGAIPKLGLELRSGARLRTAASPTVALRLGLWERTARTEILEQSTSAPRILSADVADAIEAWSVRPTGDLCRLRSTRTPS